MLDRKNLDARLRRLGHIALDLDGTIYLGETLFPFTQSFLALLDELGIGYTFLTNNSSKSSREYLAHLAGIGIQANQAQLWTSTQATIAHLRRSFPRATRLFVLGTSSLMSEFADAGFCLTQEDAADEPGAVVVGFDTSLIFPRLCRAAWWIRKGKPFIATHPDRVCPTDQPTVLVDCGSICAALEQASGRKPDAVLGKPDPRMLEGILKRHHLQPDQLAMAGDRLYTDMAMARAAGALSVLVLTGETRSSDITAAGLPVDLIVQDLSAFGELLRSARL